MSRGLTLSKESRKNESGFANKQLIQTVKRLIEIYKKEFGPSWESAFRETITIGL